MNPYRRTPLEFAKTVGLPPEGHSHTAEENKILENVDTRIVDEGGVTEFGVPFATDDFVLDRRMR